MAKKKHSTQEKPVSATVEDLTQTENFLDRNKKTLLGAGGVVIAVLLGYIGYQKFIVEPNNDESKAVLWNAYYDFENDSLDRAINGTAYYDGLESIAADYEGTSGGDIANYSMGIISMENGDFETALSYFESCNFDDVIVGSLCLGLQGDCYVELGDYEKAVKLFESAAKREANDFTTPMFLMKAGIVYEALGENAKANTNYKIIKNDYGKSDYGSDIDKYIGRTNI